MTEARSAEIEKMFREMGLTPLQRDRFLRWAEQGAREVELGPTEIGAASNTTSEHLDA